VVEWKLYTLSHCIAKGIWLLNDNFSKTSLSEKEFDINLSENEFDINLSEIIRDAYNEAWMHKHL
jgi:hypothetical protein